VSVAPLGVDAIHRRIGFRPDVGGAAVGGRRDRAGACPRVPMQHDCVPRRLIHGMPVSLVTSTHPPSGDSRPPSGSRPTGILGDDASACASSTCQPPESSR